MDYFYQVDKGMEIPSRQAFSQAREKIGYTAFNELFEDSCKIAIGGEENKLRKGYRLFAVDGTSFVVGNMARLSEYFGKSTTVPGKAMCRIGGVVDILEEAIVSAEVSPFSVGERTLAIKQIENLKAVPNALYLLDRGYWSPELVTNIIDNGQKFLMRLASNTGETKVKDENGADLRRYSFILPGGGEEILLTNIPEEEMSDDELADLYAKRWGIETKYLELKDRLQIDKFSGESVNIVLQDIYSTLYISNLSAFLCAEADDMIAAKAADKENKYRQKANRAVCIAAFRRRFIDLVLMDDPEAQSSALCRLRDDISKCVSYVGFSKPRPRDKRKIKISRSIKRLPLL